MKTILVTGTSSGIGNQICIQAAAMNFRVISVSRNIEPLKDLGGIESFKLDITDKDSVDDFVTNLKNRKIKIDILINNAGYLVSELFSETTYDSFKKTFDVNVFGLAEITRSLIPVINKDGHVINISSIGGVNGSKKFPGLSAYSSSKAAVIALTEVLAEEYQDGPSFNVLALGAVQTKMLKEAFPDYSADTKPGDMAKYILNFAINGNVDLINEHQEALGKVNSSQNETNKFQPVFIKDPTYPKIARKFNRNGYRHGGIRIVGNSGVSYQSISDYREKTDEKPIEDAIGTIKKLEL